LYNKKAIRGLVNHSRTVLTPVFTSPQRRNGAGIPRRSKGGATIINKICCTMWNEKRKLDKTSIGERRAIKRVARPKPKSQGCFFLTSSRRYRLANCPCWWKW
jgi:hypothetical protein